jgi:L-rhamnose mutarotase
MKAAFKMKLFPGCREEYKRRHSALWPELKSLLKENGISDYTIFLDEETDTLFAVMRKHDTLTKDLSQHPIMKKWWAYMKDMMETYPDDSPVTADLVTVFHID